MESKYDLGNILQPNVELHQEETEEPNGLVVGNDPKTAFLNELKDLLERYNANLSPDVDCRLWLQLGKEYVVWDSVEIGRIDASNIFDYDK